MSDRSADFEEVGEASGPVPVLRPRCLLVEDNPVQRLLVGVLLERIGLDHVAVGCGEEAILRLARETFDAVLIDVEMDGLAGLATAGRIAMLAGNDGPLVMALGSAGLDEDDMTEAGLAGMVETPVDTDGLISALVGALERRLADQPLLM